MSTLVYTREKYTSTKFEPLKINLSSTYLSVCVSICLTLIYVCLSVCLSVYVSMYLCIYLSIYAQVYLLQQLVLSDYTKSPYSKKDQLSKRVRCSGLM